jgi:hypothetical protein
LLKRGAAARVSGTINAPRGSRYTAEGEHRSGLLADAEGYGEPASLLRRAGNGSGRHEQNDCRKNDGNGEYCNLSESEFHVFSSWL